MPADIVAIETALHAWVVAETGLPDAQVRFDKQGATRPEVPFATIRIDGDTAPGLLDEQRISENPDAAATVEGAPGGGNEIILETVTQGEFTVTVQVYTADVIGASSARALALKARNGLSKESTIEALDQAGVAVIDRGTVQNLTGLLETDYEGRAAFDVRCRAADGTEEFTTFIETVETVSALE